MGVYYGEVVEQIGKDGSARIRKGKAVPNIKYNQ
jgi:hypothetical protein